jgi:hypothetical protein
MNAKYTLKVYAKHLAKMKGIDNCVNVFLKFF